MSTKVALHPLTMLNVSDGYSRMLEKYKISASDLKDREEDESHEVCSVGVLLGTKTGEKYNINTSFVILVERGVIDQQYLQERLSQFKIVLPDLYMVGFYQAEANAELSASSFSMSILNQLASAGMLEDGTLLLLFDPVRANIEASYAEGGFPIKIHRFQDTEGISLEELSISIESSDAERVGIETIINSKDSTTELDILKQKISSQKYATNKLSERVEIVLDYLKGIISASDGITTEDYARLRELNSVVNRLNYKPNDTLLQELDSRELNANFTSILGLLVENLNNAEKLNFQTIKSLQQSKYLLFESNMSPSNAQTNPPSSTRSYGNNDRGVSRSSTWAN